MTKRLYYDDSYMTEFDAVVEKTDMRGDKQIIALNRSAFYPTSGGQPFDTGTINEAHVTDVFVDKSGEVWHETDGDFAIGDSVRGRIDWERRFDHMQQHGGEHMIAGAIYNLTGGMTIGLHLGAEVSSIDVDFPDGSTHADDKLIEEIEDYVNDRIQRDMPVKCWFPDAEELASLPLRKKPTVSEHVRIVAMGDFEMVACGGTHPSTTGQIGLVKIVSAAPARGKLRVSFVCGKRALADYRRNYNTAWAAANALTTHPDNLVRNIEALSERLRQAEHALSILKREALFSGIPTILNEADSLPGGAKLICRMIDGDAALVKDFASKLIEEPGRIVLLGTENDARCSFVFARSADVDADMGRLLSGCAKQCGGKGGGRPDFAQGGGSKEILNVAREKLINEERLL